MVSYSDFYLYDAMRNLGSAFDYAVNIRKISLSDFLNLFINSAISVQFGNGNPKYISGISGTELAMEIMSSSDFDSNAEIGVKRYDRSPEYWCGWVLAYYQWYSGKDFRRIMDFVSAEDLLNMYPTLHEASEEKFVETMDFLIESRNVPTRLQQMRRLACYSQKMLAQKSGVSLRMIQQYEQRVKDINKATGQNLRALSRTLGCRMEDLME